MRTFLIIFVTLLVLGGGFLVYSLMESPAGTKAPRVAISSSNGKSSRATPSTTQNLRGIGAGESVWVKRYDPNTGELSSQFKGEKYDPQAGNIVRVEKPQAEFFSADGEQRLRIEGATGDVVMTLPPEDKPGKFQGRMTAEAPNRGVLQDVVISMFEPADAAEPILVARMNNAAFDNETFRIATESFTDAATGLRVQADQVPVTVRGRDYDFDGRGLVIRWNERDQKLHLLEIAHGESLTVKNLEALGQPDLVSPTTLPARGQGPVALPVMLASADRRAFVLAAATPATGSRRAKRPPRPAASASTAPAPTSRPKIVRDDSPVVYRATLESDVRIFEADAQIASAERLEIDMLQKRSEDADPTTSATQPTTRHASATKPAKKKASTQESKATSQPIRGPITVKWTGKLRVVPLEGGAPPDASLVAGKAVVRMVGAPVVLTREGTEARCGEVKYNSADGAATLKANDVVPIVTLKDSGGATVTTPSLTYAQDEQGQRTAMLIGKSRAEIPLEGGKLGERLVASWANEGVLHLSSAAGEPGGKLAIDRAAFYHDVNIDHPQLKMTSNALTLAFEPSSSKASNASTKPGKDDVAGALREIVAEGKVNCQIAAGDGKRQAIEAEKLRVETDRSPAGETYAKLVEADGKVRTSQGDDELRAGYLLAKLAPAPATQPAANAQASLRLEGAGGSANPLANGDVRLVSLVARDNVTLATADGTNASADLLEVETTADGKERYKLTGAPTASVGDGKTTITGPVIRFAPDEKLAEIAGAGTIHGARPDKPGEVLDIAWRGGAVVNGNTNLIDVTDQIVVKSTEAGGATTNTATSDKLQAKLGPSAAPSKLTTNPAAATATTKPSDRMNFLAGKEITAATLNGRVKVVSETRSPGDGGALLQGLNLNGETVTYDQRTGRMEVPGAGEMLYQDRRPPEQTPDNAAAAAAAKGPTLSGGGRGATAFQWSKSLVYDQATRQAVMTGDVRVVHQPEGKDGGQPFNLWADTMAATMEPDPQANAAGPAGVPGAAGGEKVRLRKVAARGSVRVQSARMNVDAHELTFDPLSHLLTATGNGDEPITVFDNERGQSQTAGSLEWNTETDQFRVRDLRGKLRQ